MFVPGSFFQNCWVVPNLEDAIRRWVDTAHAGPFFINAHVQGSNLHYRGRPTKFDHSIALGQVGPIQIELVEQHDATPSVYRDSVPAGAEDFHHMGGFVDDFDAEIARYRTLGAELAYGGVWGNMRFAYLDTRAQLGFMLEVLERDPAVIEIFKWVADAAVGWDGRDPIRSFPTG
jgi:hypothetical protein